MTESLEISPLDIEITRSIGRLEGKVDALGTVLTAHAAEDRDWHQKLDTRLRGIEDSHAQGIGRQSVLSTMLGLVAGAVAGYLGKHFG